MAGGGRILLFRMKIYSRLITVIDFHGIVLCFILEIEKHFPSH